MSNKFLAPGVQAIAKPTPTLEDVQASYEGLLQSYMELTDAQRNLDEVCQAMDNINLSMKMIQTGGMEAVTIINVDKSLEALCGIEAKLLTAEKAMEALDAQNKSGWEKFKEWVGKVAKAVADFFRAFANRIMLFFDKGDAAAKKLSSVDEEKLVNALKEKKVSPSTEGLVSEYFKDIRPGQVFSYDEFYAITEEFGVCFGKISEKVKEYFYGATPLLRKLVENPTDDATKSALDKLRESALGEVSKSYQHTSLKDALNKVTAMKQDKYTVSLYELGYTSKDKLLKALQYCTGMRRTYTEISRAADVFAKDMVDETDSAIDSVIEKANLKYSNDEYALRSKLTDAANTYVTVSREASDLFSTCLHLVNATRSMIIDVIDNVTNSVDD